ncbi:MAG: hypothetical protein BWY31_04532 [Lentisphaerae bacterium ADurb.Bin242]|nr:MAG: hypothetical protein BWY31_04532 [Lentisphaerae bacterium ADurb.Bin242]
MDIEKANRILSQLMAQVNNAGIPNLGVCIGESPYEDKGRYCIDYLPDASEAQREQGQAILDNFILQKSETCTPLDFLDRFTPEEIAAINASSNIFAVVFRTSLLAAQKIELDNPRTASGMNKLVEIGLLSEARRTEIMNDNGVCK